MSLSFTSTKIEAIRKARVCPSSLTTLRHPSDAVHALDGRVMARNLPGSADHVVTCTMLKGRAVETGHRDFESVEHAEWVSPWERSVAPGFRGFPRKLTHVAAGPLT